MSDTYSEGGVALVNLLLRITSIIEVLYVFPV